MKAEQLVTIFKDHDISFYTGVPDSLLKHFCRLLEAREDIVHKQSTNEGSAIGLAIGAYIGSRKQPVVYMQNSGLGNCINPLTSLCHPKIYGIPIVLVIGWRGEMEASGLQLRDEPQHIFQGQITEEQLRVLEIPYEIIDSACNQRSTIDLLLDKGLAERRPVALLVRKGGLDSEITFNREINSALMSREECIRSIVKMLDCKSIIVSTTGMASRELYEIRKELGLSHSRDFLTVGGMGHASQICAGIASFLDPRKVVCIDGDGSVLMHMGSLCISSSVNNMIHVVVNNGAHDSVGGQETMASKLELHKIASASGYKSSVCVASLQALKTALSSAIDSDESAFIEVKCKKGARKDLGRPTTSPLQNINDLMNFIDGLEK